MDATELRQTANNLVRVVGVLAMQSIDGLGDLEALGRDLATVRSATEICRGAARRLEAKAAQADDTVPLCMGCRHRKDRPGGPECNQGLEIREASVKRACRKYDAE